MFAIFEIDRQTGNNRNETNRKTNILLNKAYDSIIMRSVVFQRSRTEFFLVVVFFSSFYFCCFGFGTKPKTFISATMQPPNTTRTVNGQFEKPGKRPWCTVKSHTFCRRTERYITKIVCNDPLLFGGFMSFLLNLISFSLSLSLSLPACLSGFVLHLFL